MNKTTSEAGIITSVLHDKIETAVGHRTEKRKSGA